MLKVRVAPPVDVSVIWYVARPGTPPYAPSRRTTLCAQSRRARLGANIACLRRVRSPKVLGGVASAYTEAAQRRSPCVAAWLQCVKPVQAPVLPANIDSIERDAGAPGR